MADASIVSEWVVNIGRREAKARLAHLICEMATRVGVTGTRNDFQFDFAITQSQLAEATALTPVHVNRTLKSLTADGLLEWKHRAVHVFNWQGLVEIGEFDPAYLHLHAEPQQRLSLMQA
jgi:CRP-like cAMP-binding protein